MIKEAQLHPNNLPINKFARKEDPAVREIARKIESQFVQMLLEEMNKTAQSETPESSANEFYKGLLTSEYANVISKQKEGIGLQKIIMAELQKNRAMTQNITNDYSKAKEATHE